MSVRKTEDLKDRIAVVTGAAQGLGFGMARALGERGALVVIADIQRDKAIAAAESLDREGFNVHGAALDVADSHSVADFFDQHIATHKRLDILVNNAGVGQKVTPIVDLYDDEWNRVLGVTLTGTFFCCRSAARLMRKQESGSIVNISSINGQNPAALVAAYNAAKAAVISLTKTLALELAAYGVRVNAVCPGPVYTDFNRTVMAALARAWE